MSVNLTRLNLAELNAEELAKLQEAEKVINGHRKSNTGDEVYLIALAGQDK